MHYKLADHILTVLDNQVFSNGSKLPLSQRGHDCLMLFLQSNNSVLSKESLMAELWQDVIVSDDSLFKVIQDVRKVLLDIGLSKDALQNVYGKGYQIKPTIVVVKAGFWTKKLVSILAITVFVMASAAFWFWPKSHQISDAEFARLVAEVEANQVETNAAWPGLSINRNASTTDQLKLAYLNGLNSYQSGQYDDSIRQLKAGIEVFADGESNHVLADAYLLLSKMYIYRADKHALLGFLNQAELNYTQMGDAQGLFATGISRARYLQSVYQFPESITMLQKIIADAERAGDQYYVLRAYANLAYAYQQMQQQDQYISSLQSTLEMALEQSDGRYAALAYGQLSAVYLLQGEPVKAMKFAQQALNFVLAQHDTNIFQQGFSAYYNILHELGHFDLAAKYLLAAINIQAKFNDESVLAQAEINLVRVHISLQQYEQAKLGLQKLLSSDLSVAERFETESLHALISYQLKDNITAYTQAKQVFESGSAPLRVKFQAGIVLVLASYQLERTEEVIMTFAQLQSQLETQTEPLRLSHWRFEYQQYLSLAMLYYSETVPDENKAYEIEQLQQAFMAFSQSITEQTVTTPLLIDSLDSYILQILNP